MEKQLATTKPWEPPPPGLTKDKFLGYYGIIAGQDDYDPGVHEELEQKWKEYRGYGGKRRSKKSKSKSKGKKSKSKSKKSKGKKSKSKGKSKKSKSKKSKSKSKKSKSKSRRRGRGRRQRGGQGPAAALNPPPLSPAQDILNR